MKIIYEVKSAKGNWQRREIDYGFHKEAFDSTLKYIEDNPDDYRLIEKD